MTVFSLCALMVEGTQELSGVSFIRTLIPFKRALLLGLNYLPGGPSSHTVILSFRISTYEVGRTETFRPQQVASELISVLTAGLNLVVVELVRGDLQGGPFTPLHGHRVQLGKLELNKDPCLRGNEQTLSPSLHSTQVRSNLSPSNLEEKSLLLVDPPRGGSFVQYTRREGLLSLRRSMCPSQIPLPWDSKAAAEL